MNLATLKKVHLADPKKRNRLLLATGSVIGILATIWFGLVGPMSAELRGLAENRDLAKAQFQNAKLAVENKERVALDLERALDRLKGIEQGIAQGDNYRWMFNTMFAFLTNYNVRCDDITPPAGGTAKPVVEIPPYEAVTFVVAGGAGCYHDFGKFLADFENRFRQIRLRSLELEPATDVRSDPDHPGKLNFRMELVVLAKPAAATPAPPGAPKK